MADLNTEKGFCSLKEHHGYLQARYFCLQADCQLKRILCGRCVKEVHCRHKIGPIDRLVEPLSRLCLNSGAPSAEQDYNFLNDKLREICDEWEKLNELFLSNVRELQEGILFQFTTVMKTFTNDEVDRAYDVLLNAQSRPQDINDIVEQIKFLSKDYFEDVDAVKKFSETIAERVKKCIGKTVKKVDFILRKMQTYIRELDFTKYEEFHGSQATSELHLKSFDKNDDKDSTAKRDEEDEEDTRPRSKKLPEAKRRPQSEELSAKLGRVGFSRKSAFQRC